MIVNLEDMSSPYLSLEGIEEREEPGEFQNLPTDVLLSIFYFCDVSSLLSLSQTCKRFHSIINEDTVWVERSRTVNVSNQVSNEIKNRSFYILPHKDRYRLSQNWNSGRYNEKVFLGQKTKFMPWIQLECEVLWLSRGPKILTLQRKSSSIGAVPLLTLHTQKEDVSRFVVRNGQIISGGRDGSLCAWNTRNGSLLFHERDVHSSDVTDVDCNNNNVIVTGSKDKTIKVWSFRNDVIKLKMSVLVDDRVWAVALKPCAGDILCYGTSGHNRSKSPLGLYDVEMCQMLSLEDCHRKYGAGVLHVLWEDPHTLLSCGYDSTLRIWDTRTAKCMQVWTDPYDAVLYSLASDHKHTLFCGTAQHGRVQMWDKRHSKSLQMYFMKSTHSSPVYSLSFDPVHLFVALDQSLNMMDFSGFQNIAKDYRDTSIYNL